MRTPEDYTVDYLNDAADAYSHEILTKHFAHCIEETKRSVVTTILAHRCPFCNEPTESRSPFVCVDCQIDKGYTQ